jgi:23S rRNA (adenine2503-C2)-methyltransferase
MDREEIEKFLKDNAQPKFRLDQILKAVYQDGVSDFSEISTLSKDLREKLSAKMKVLSFEVEKVLEAEDKQSAKALFKLTAGHPDSPAGEEGSNNTDYIESVLISPKPNTFSVCVSSQVGCPMRCEFCATGKMGLKRNLTAEEITDQVLFWQQYLQKSKIQNTKSKKNPNSKIGNWDLEIGNYNISNVVYMGMGEPFLNWEEVKKSLEILTDKNIFGFGSRGISVSTCGIPSGIENFGKDFPQMNLAISLHFASEEKRKKYMPVAKSYDLEKLKQSLQKYFQLSNRKVFIEYVMLDGINDSQEDAEKLLKYLQSIGKKQLLHVNLIRYNDASGDFAPSSKNKTENFKKYLQDNGISATIRKSLGQEIQGACGQLATFDVKK